MIHQHKLSLWACDLSWQGDCNVLVWWWLLLNHKWRGVSKYPCTLVFGPTLWTFAALRAKRPFIYFSGFCISLPQFLTQDPCVLFCYCRMNCWVAGVSEVICGLSENAHTHTHTPEWLKYGDSGRGISKVLLGCKEGEGGSYHTRSVLVKYGIGYFIFYGLWVREVSFKRK